MVGGAGAAEGEGDVVAVVGVGVVELGPGIAGNGGTAVCSLTEPFAITSAITNATASSTAAAATTHSQRGDLGPGGGGGASPAGGAPPGGGWSWDQYWGGNFFVGFVSCGFGAHSGLE
ncbi:hypothetical protein MLAC_10780 [Mycobacterium lacus]|uniref:Uncharacterized protein n=1 Tax=Mycobacterium lacus TaxID=169765 RepID=A0A7I7NGX1_9MYCO|nr:hypothetical protein MLAC_10780 [Mycobacterium lacus]